MVMQYTNDSSILYKVLELEPVRGNKICMYIVFILSLIFILNYICSSFYRKEHFFTKAFKKLLSQI